MIFWNVMPALLPTPRARLRQPPQPRHLSRLGRGPDPLGQSSHDQTIRHPRTHEVIFKRPWAEEQGIRVTTTPNPYLATLFTER